MKFFSRKRRADGVEIAHYHGEAFCNTYETYSSAEGFASKDSFQAPEVHGNKAKENIKGSSILTIDKGYTDRGPTLDISFSITYPYDEYTVFEFPQSCLKCPVGFQKDSKCGRNVPFNEEDYIKRPTTCKLKMVKLDDIKHDMLDKLNHLL